MQIRPVPSPTAPRYPSEAVFASRPELFLRYVPSRWRNHKVVGPALTAFVLAGLGGCRSETSDPVSDRPPIAQGPQERKTTVAKSASKVAPIFAHGDGSGSTGCMAMSPPVFLSEEEALRLIGTELAKAGIHMERVDAPDVEFDVAHTTNREGSQVEDSIYFEKATLRMDGFVRDRRFVVEYVSHEDGCAFGTSEVGCMDFYHPKRGAELLRQALVDSGSYDGAVFYEPMPHLSYEDLAASRDGGEQLARDLLLAQVRDFLEWVKREKVLD